MNNTEFNKLISKLSDYKMAHSYDIIGYLQYANNLRCKLPQKGFSSELRAGDTVYYLPKYHIVHQDYYGVSSGTVWEEKLIPSEYILDYVKDDSGTPYEVGPLSVLIIATNNAASNDREDYFVRPKPCNSPYQRGVIISDRSLLYKFPRSEGFSKEL